MTFILPQPQPSPAHYMRKGGSPIGDSRRRLLPLRKRGKAGMGAKEFGVQLQ